MTGRLCTLKGIGNEKDFKKFDKNRQIYRPKEGTQKVLKFLGVSFNFISQSKFLAVMRNLGG